MPIDPIEIAKQKAEQIADVQKHPDENLDPRDVQEVHQYVPHFRADALRSPEGKERLSRLKIGTTMRYERLNRIRVTLDARKQDLLEKLSTLKAELEKPESVPQTPVANTSFVETLLPDGTPSWLKETLKGAESFIRSPLTMGAGVLHVLQQPIERLSTAAGKLLGVVKWLLLGAAAITGMSTLFPKIAEKVKNFFSPALDMIKSVFSPGAAPAAGPAPAPTAAPPPAPAGAPPNAPDAGKDKPPTEREISQAIDRLPNGPDLLSGSYSPIKIGNLECKFDRTGFSLNGRKVVGLDGKEFDVSKVTITKNAFLMFVKGEKDIVATPVPLAVLPKLLLQLHEKKQVSFMGYGAKLQ